MKVHASFTTTLPVPDCHILFISQTAERKLASIFEQARNRPILTISDIPGFAYQGGMIELVRVQEGAAVYLRPRVNVTATERSHLRLSADLLLLADHVHHA